MKSFIKISPYGPGPSPCAEINLLVGEELATKSWSRFYLSESLKLLANDFELPLEELRFKSHSEFKTYSHYRFSLSHNPDLIAIWLWESKLIASAGIDIEWAQRPHSPRLKTYLTHSQDDFSELSALEFFCVKEAAFKCLHNLGSLETKPKSLNQISIRGENFHFLDKQGNFRIKKIFFGSRQLIIAMAQVER